jgi:hypothetical protein
MKHVTFGGVGLDACDKGCGGLWFDGAALPRIDAKRESGGEPLLDILPHQWVWSDPDTPRYCPSCPRKVMLERHFYTIRREVEIDACPTCGAVFLDCAELAALHREAKSADDRRRIGEQHFAPLFAERFPHDARKSPADDGRIRKFTAALRFICPKVWLPAPASPGTG